MADPAPSRCSSVHPTLAVHNVEAAVDFYTRRLGFTVDFLWGEPPNFAGVRLDRVSVHLSQSGKPAVGSKAYFIVDAIDPLFERHSADPDVEIADGLEDCPWGMREYAVRDLDGHELRFGQPIPATEPPLPIERVEVAVRLETRLAALLADLAEHKGMTVGECLEETLLHTFEAMGEEGVASPHTQTTLDEIERLKAVHGIDYDTHASYRFVETTSTDE